MDSTAQSMTDMAMTQATSPGLGKHMSMANIDKTSKDFESMFMTQMLQPMFEGIGVDPTFGGGHGEEIMRTFLVQEYGKIASQSGKLGIAAAVKNEMIKSQENSTKVAGGSYANIK